MEYYIDILIDRLEWTEEYTKLTAKYKNMKLEVKVSGNEVEDVEGWVYMEDDWDVMYEVLRNLNEIKYLIEQKFLYGSS